MYPKRFDFRHHKKDFQCSSLTDQQQKICNYNPGKMPVINGQETAEPYNDLMIVQTAPEGIVPLAGAGGYVAPGTNYASGFGGYSQPYMPPYGGNMQSFDVGVQPDFNAGRQPTNVDFGSANAASNRMVTGSAPHPEKRIDTDGNAYTKSEFLQFFGGAEGQVLWSDAPPVKRYAPDGTAYTQAEFVEWYGGYDEWGAAPSIAQVREQFES